MDARIALVFSVGLVLAMGAAPARAQKEVPGPSHPESRGRMPGMHYGMSPMLDGHVSRGRVERVDRERGTVTIDHEDIPGLMKAMTMTFEVADRTILDDVSSGQAIDFRVEKDGGRYVVTEIHIAD